MIRILYRRTFLTYSGKPDGFNARLIKLYVVKPAAITYRFIWSILAHFLHFNKNIPATIRAITKRNIIKRKKNITLSDVPPRPAKAIVSKLPIINNIAKIKLIIEIKIIGNGTLFFVSSIIKNKRQKGL